MHEISVMSGIVETLLDKLEGRDFFRVVRVRLQVGKLTFLSDEALEFAFTTMIRDTPLNGAELVIEKIEARGKCPNCGHETVIKLSEDPAYHFTLPSFSCPNCNTNLDIIQGTECYVKDMDIEVPD